MKKVFSAIVVVGMILTLSGCASLDKRDYATAGGAVAGGVVGNVLTGGSALGTVAGAAGGALVGNQLAK